MARKEFDYSLDYSSIDFRKHPELYRVGKGEQGVLMVEPYKSEILPHWRFKTPWIAQRSSKKIYELFLAYKRKKDFVGMDMARKFLQMGWTRSRRYANHKSGHKWSADRSTLLEQDIDEVKAKSAEIFYKRYQLAKNDALYQRLKREHQERYG